MENSFLLDVRSLSVEVTGRPLVKEVNFTLNAGKTLCLVGESGSGKTTTALALMGLLSKKRGFRATGEAFFEGKNVLAFEDYEWQRIRGKDIAMIFQDPAASLNPILSIGDQVQEMFEIHTEDSCEKQEALTVEALASVGLDGIKNPFQTYPHQLSGGMKQRVMIAMSLCLGPKLLIADEPTSALDLTVQKEILEQLSRFQGALLLITHDFGVVAFMADYVAVMYRGTIVEYNSVEAILAHPQHPYTKALLAARPTKENRRKMLPMGMP